MKDLDRKILTLKKMKEWSRGEDGRAYFELFQKRIEYKLVRYKKFEKYLEDNDFDKLMYRIIGEHDENYRENSYHNGFEPRPNNKLYFIFDYVTHMQTPINVKEINSKFPNDIWEFKGYYFQLTYGQGTLFDLYNKTDLRHLLQL